MIKIQLTGQVSPTYEYVKLLLSRKLEYYGIPAFIDECLSPSTESYQATIEIENYQPTYIIDMEGSARLIQSLIDQVIADKKVESPINIVVPIDMSDSSINAAHYAIQLSETIHSPVKIIHYLNPVLGPNGLTLTVNKNIENARRKQFEVSVDKLKALYPHLDEGRIQSEILVADFGKGIHELSQSLDRQLIILGSKGASGLAKTIFGSSVLNALRQSDCPILVIPDGYKNHSFNKLSLALEHYQLNKEDLTFLELLTKRSAAQVELVTVTNDKEDVSEWKGKIKNSVLKDAIDGVSILDTNIVHGLESYLQNSDTDMLVLTPKKKNVFEGIFKKSVTKKMALNSKIPILVLNHQCHCKEGRNCCKINKMSI